MGNQKSENSSTDVLAQEANPNQVPVSELLKQYVKHVETGALFQTLQDTKNSNKLYLRSKNVCRSFDKKTISQGVVNGVWATPNEHEVRKHITSENEYLVQLQNRIMKRAIYTQILLELDSELMKDFEDDKYINGLLVRCEKQFERLLGEVYNRLYATDKEFLMNMMNGIDSVVKKLAGCGIEQLFIIDKMMDDYLADPEKYIPETVEFVKIDAE